MSPVPRFHTLILFVLTGLVSSWAMAEQKPENRVYVPNVTGDLSSEKVGEALASAVVTALMSADVEAYTERNLRDQLKEEKNKEILNCNDDTHCINEIVASYGLARRLFGSVLKLGPDRYQISVTLNYRDKVMNHKAVVVNCTEDDLLREFPALALDVMGLTASSGSSGKGEAGVKVTGGSTEWNPNAGKSVLVSFVSSPRGAVVLVDGNLVCSGGLDVCSKELPVGRHKVEMQKEKYIKKSEYVEISQKTTINWDLTPDFATLIISRSPANLNISVDGSPLQNGNNIVLEITPDIKHKVVVDDPCYEPIEADVAGIRGQKLELPLNPDPRPSAIKVSAIDGLGNAIEADVFVDNIQLGTTPDTFKIPLCSRNIQVKARGKTFTSPLTLRERDTTVIEARLDGAEKVVVQDKPISKPPKTSTPPDSDGFAIGLSLSEGYFWANEASGRTAVAATAGTWAKWGWFRWMPASLEVAFEGAQTITLSTGFFAHVAEELYLLASLDIAFADDKSYWGLRTGLGYAFDLGANFALDAELNLSFWPGDVTVVPLETRWGLRYTF